MTENLAIETRDLTKSYDGVTVVDRLTLQVKENEVFGLLGPNGAGKTTTILMLLGLTEPASGTVRVCGFNPTREPLKVKRIVGYLPEKVGFYENLTARENLEFIADLNNISPGKSSQRIGDVLKMVGLENEKNMVVGKYSRGMKQRLGIADVLIKEPKMVFLDEPTSGLDPKGINQLLDLIAGLPKMGTTVLLSSHQLYQVQKVCHSIGILAKGKMVLEGSIDELGREALSAGRYVMEIETAAPSAQLADTLRKMKGVVGVEVKDNTFRVSTDSDIRGEIARVVVQSDTSLIQMKVQEFSLDDIYMKYFKES
ncbi:MAG: ABC transporter ATP-binding protein [Chloroflexi bacterium RBG_16_50_9]|nr:MAG: ABC transporter ATP-binding protein [Chloroflexi bacterium RBG_16_50_9]